MKPRREPEAPLLVNYSAPRDTSWFPYALTTPEARGRLDLGCGVGRKRYFARHILDRVYVSKDVTGCDGAVYPPVRVDRGIAPVRRDGIVHVIGGPAPVPQGDNEVALDPGGTWRLHLRQRARRNAISPVSEHRALSAKGTEKQPTHCAGRHAPSHAMIPCFSAGAGRPEPRGELPSIFVSQLMTGHTALQFTGKLIRRQFAGW